MHDFIVDIMFGFWWLVGILCIRHNVTCNIIDKSHIYGSTE
ncbi:gluconate utilization system Gnt-I transcriptional repressor domain protein [Vibrio parahaemolyticus VP2007-095]|nr:gluconate utilization system Gnt-I transcriptional repressor domain protein [Vibrio parahaemolyticus VP2007-095]